MTNIAATLKSLMDRDGVSQTALSEATGVPQPTIHRLLSGEAIDPRTKTIAPIAQYFGLTADELRAGLLIPSVPVIDKIFNRAYRIKPDDSQLPELTPDAIEVAQAYMELPASIRRAVKPLIFLIVAGSSMAPSILDDFEKPMAVTRNAKKDEEEKKSRVI